MSLGIAKFVMIVRWQKLVITHKTIISNNAFNDFRKSFFLLLDGFRNVRLVDNSGELICRNLS